MFTMRVPTPLLDRVRAYALERGVPVSHAIIEAVEIFFFDWAAPEMEQEILQDQKNLGHSRHMYFRSLLDARYRHLVIKKANAEAEPVKKSKQK